MSKPTPMDELLTADEVAAALSVTPRTLLRWQNLGIGPNRTKFSKKVFYRASALREWIERCEQAPPNRQPAPNVRHLAPRRRA